MSERARPDAMTLLPGEAVPEPPAPAAAGGALAAGTVLFGEYEVLEVLGQGGMGAVYRARHRSLSSARAIKVMRPELSSDPTALQLFLREAHALLEVQHDAVVRCHDLLRDSEGRFYLVMELVDGVPLSERIARGALGEGELTRLALRVVEGLEAAHARGVVHRDLAPDNILLPEGRVERAKLIDFGIAKVAGGGNATETVGLGFKGKLLYASPEQLGLFGGSVDARSDLYSLGLILAQAASGRALAMGGTLAASIEARRTLPPLPSHLGRGWRELLRRLLAPSPEDRPRSAAELHEELLGIGDGRSREPRRRARVLGLVGVAALLVALGTTFVLREAPWRIPSQPAEPAPEEPGDFARARLALEQAAGPWTEAAARVWTEPQVVRDGEAYTIGFQADCDCQVLLFSLDGARERVDLLYPNPFEPALPLRTDTARRIPSSGKYRLRAVGGDAEDVLKLVVTDAPLAFPPAGSEGWSASPDEPERVGELVALLERLRALHWASAETRLRIRR